MKTFYIIDISSFFFRSYYAIPGQMTSPSGLPTNALYGVLSMLLRLIRDHKPDYIAVGFDTKTPSFRKGIFPEYKANRVEMPEDLEKQVPELKKMIQILNIYGVERKGYEADDIIGTLARWGTDHNLKVFIVSGDKDFAQLVDKNTALLDTMKSKMYYRKDVYAKWKVYPEQMIDYLALTGDSSDNIPGIKGIGPKGAASLLGEYENLDNIYNNINKINKALQKKLQSGKEDGLLSKKLVTIVRDLKIDCTLTDMTLKEPDESQFKSFLEELNFSTFLKTLYPEKKQKNQVTPQRQLIKHCWTEEDVARQLEPYASLWLGEWEGRIYFGYKKQLIELASENLKDFAPVLDDKWIRWSGYGLKSLWGKLGLKKPLPEWDSMVAGHLLDSRPSGSFHSLCKQYLKSEEPPENPEDFYRKHNQLKDILETQLKALHLDTLFYEVELPLIPVLYDMENHGMLLNRKEVEKQSSQLEEDLKVLEQNIFQLCGTTFNLASPKQLGEVLFDKLNLPQGRKIKSGRSTDSRELMKLKGRHPALPLILEYRELFKLKTTYTSSLLELAHPKTCRIHTCFRQTATATGRLSSVHPNLQNIPIKTERGKQIRRAFTAPEGFLLVSADYSQIELRILAHITEDPGLLKAFQEGRDIHAATASEIFNVPLKEVTPELRRKSKAVNFGIAYGQGAYGLAESLGISRAEGKAIIESYFKKFKRVRDYIEMAKELSKGYVETLFGRKRFFAEWELKNPQLRAASERAAINAPIQGTASDIVKKAMIELDRSLPLPLVSQVHDELLFECPREQWEQEKPHIISIMENCVRLKAPLKVNCVAGSHWAEAHF